MTTARRRAARETLVAWAFLLPALLAFAYFKFLPMLKGIQFSFYKVNFGGENTWVGWNNFRTVLGDPAFRLAIWHTVVNGIAVAVISAAIALVVALALQGGTRSVHFVRSAIFLPAVTSVAIVAEIFKLLYYPSAQGPLNMLLGYVGIAPQPFFSSPDTALASLIGMQVWKAVPYDTAIFIAGLATINRDLYDAANVDGASPWQRFMNVTLPGLAPTLTIILTLAIIRGFRVFTEVYTTTGGGPGGATDVVMTRIYKLGFETFDYGLASAASTLMFIVTAVLTSLYLLRTWKKT
ncbi:carbohydrate ABC transporter permease [Deinococcus marmoris]|uniref:ABC type sugar transport system, permease protein n=1 Tax=Deinococcus marmoris TaxID=249408 RepID=A0A1U7NUV0_9DEIO|nr:sugar ABC transporter permease [Deinococcus marmoris]OLV16698.1 ABC type sugar transport system, permease protein precursor [Deinococcus marmoris]